jgi:hypothetical protein
MYDAIFLATIVAFFALCVAYIKACDWIIGPDAEFELDLVAESGDDGAPTPVGIEPIERAA